MKVRVFFDFGFKGLEAIDGFISWEYPVLPRVGEKVCSPLLFIPNKQIEDFKSIPALQYVDKSFYESYGKSKDWYSEETFFDYLNNYTGDKFVVFDIDWCWNMEEGVYPFLHIIPM